MVFFICNHCGESVKKASVDKHYLTKCRNNGKSVSCMDCSKDFFGEEYKAHNQCITEAEKYSGKDYVPKSATTKSKVQDNWGEIINRVLNTDSTLTNETRSKLELLRGYSNIPQKKAKFYNFVNNCLKWSTQDADPVWNPLEREVQNMKNELRKQKAQEKEKLKAQKRKLEVSNESEKKENVSENNADGEPPAKKKKSKKHKLSEKNEEISKDSPNADNKPATNTLKDFDWNAVLQTVMTKYQNGVSLRKLKKKLLKKYKSQLSTEEFSKEDTRKFEKRFKKNLRKNPAFMVNDDNLVVPKTISA